MAVWVMPLAFKPVGAVDSVLTVVGSAGQETSLPLFARTLSL